MPHEELTDTPATAAPETAVTDEPRHLPVPSTTPVPQPRASSRELAPSVALPVVQAAAVAAGGFVAGAAITGLVQRRRRRAPATRSAGTRRRSGRAAELVQIVGSRSLLVDVHLLGVPADR
jgi:hypothetical protein